MPLEFHTMRASDSQGRELYFEKHGAPEYRVLLCQWPVIVQMLETPLPEVAGEGRNWREALLESRSFFVDETRQYGDWGHPEAFMVEKAAVLVEHITEGGECMS
jgi:hypothetical protein